MVAVLVVGDYHCMPHLWGNYLLHIRCTVFGVVMKEFVLIHILPTDAEHPQYTVVTTFKSLGGATHHAAEMVREGNKGVFVVAEAQAVIQPHTQPEWMTFKAWDQT